MKDAKHIGAYACAMDCGGRTFRRHFAIKHIFIQSCTGPCGGQRALSPGPSDVFTTLPCVRSHCLCSFGYPHARYLI